MSKKEEYLTDLEHETLDLLATVDDNFREIVKHGDTREADLNQVIFHIHALQYMILAQAGGRAYPVYSLLGDN